MSDANTESMHTESEQDTEGEDTGEYEYLFDAGRMAVNAGRVTIPAGARREFDIEHDDVVDISVETDDGITFGATDITVTSRGQVRIPHRKRELYDIEEGDRVSLVVGTHGYSAEDLPEEKRPEEGEGGDGAGE